MASINFLARARPAVFAAGVVVGVLAFAGCGDDSGDEGGAAAPAEKPEPKQKPKKQKE